MTSSLCTSILFWGSPIGSSRINSSYVIFSPNFDIPLWTIDSLSHSNETNAAPKTLCFFHKFCLVACHDLLDASSLASKTALDDSASGKSFWKMLTITLFFLILGIDDLAGFRFGHCFFCNVI